MVMAETPLDWSALQSAWGPAHQPACHSQLYALHSHLDMSEAPELRMYASSTLTRQHKVPGTCGALRPSPMRTEYCYR